MCHIKDLGFHPRNRKYFKQINGVGLSLFSFLSLFFFKF